MASTAITTKHTPTPWHVVNGIFIRDELMPFDRDDRDTALIATASGYGTLARDEANAAFIVRACNSHKQLVDALREALRWADTARFSIDAFSAEHSEASLQAMFDNARAALAAAEA